MLYTLPDKTEVTLFVSEANGMIDAMCRAADRATWDAASVATRLAHIDEETGEVIPLPGVTMAHIGPIEVVPAATDEAGEIASPAVMDTRHHVNLRIGRPAVETVGKSGLPRWAEIALAWTQNGEPDAQINNTEEALAYGGVALINPESVTSPSMVWN